MGVVCWQHRRMLLWMESFIASLTLLSSSKRRAATIISPRPLHRRKLRQPQQTKILKQKQQKQKNTNHQKLNQKPKLIHSLLASAGTRGHLNWVTFLPWYIFVYCEEIVIVRLINLNSHHHGIMLARRLLHITYQREYSSFLSLVCSKLLLSRCKWPNLNMLKDFTGISWKLIIDSSIAIKVRSF